jgi:hypothetical protein
MYTRAAAVLLAFVLPCTAQAADGERPHERYVADTLEIVITPAGERIARLVSRSGQTARQFWVESVYPSHGTLLVFGEPSGGTPSATAQRNITATEGIAPPRPAAHHPAYARRE